MSTTTPEAPADLKIDPAKLWLTEVRHAVSQFAKTSTNAAIHEWMLLAAEALVEADLPIPGLGSYQDRYGR